MKYIIYSSMEALFHQYITSSSSIANDMDLNNIPFTDQRFEVFPQSDGTDLDEVTDTMYKNGMDMQGIIWSKQRMSRQDKRNERLLKYENYLSVKRDQDVLKEEEEIKEKIIKKVKTNGQYYEFKHSKLKEPCHYGHFQLRNLLWATSKNSVYFMRGNTVRQWSPQRNTVKEVLNPDKIINNLNTYRSMKISSMACKDQILFVGGFLGNYVIQNLNSYYSHSHHDNNDHTLTQTSSHYGLISNQHNAIINHVDILSDQKSVLISNNDMTTKLLDVNTLKIANTFQFSFPVNCSAVSPDQKMLCVVGDTNETHILDTTSNKVIYKMKDHHDFSFTCCFSPDGITLATGNQDKTTMLYDIRQLSTPLHTLGANVGGVRSLHFSNDGKYLAMAEPIDFVHIFQTHNYEKSQVIDFFGEISGVSFTPDDQALFIANNDERTGGISEFQRLHQHKIYHNHSFYI
ncbi:unnamed protein product [Cunninghamella echinulata]